MGVSSGSRRVGSGAAKSPPPPLNPPLSLYQSHLGNRALVVERAWPSLLERRLGPVAGPARGGSVARAGLGGGGGGRSGRRRRRGGRSSSRAHERAAVRRRRLDDGCARGSTRHQGRRAARQRHRSGPNGRRAPRREAAQHRAAIWGEREARARGARRPSERGRARCGSMQTGGGVGASSGWDVENLG